VTGSFCAQTFYPPGKVADFFGFQYLRDGSAAIFPPEYFVLPVDIAKALPRTEGWGNISFSSITELNSHQDNWDIIRVFLNR